MSDKGRKPCRISKVATAFRRLALAAVRSTPDFENDEVDVDRNIDVSVDTGVPDEDFGLILVSLSACVQQGDSRDSWIIHRGG